ncbi:MAG: DUF2147 domain-containing protein [Treponema sp.]|jgi:uncharacterized protein (DUF2147 family)|nr:DUF2147 domain-containing protein [Treponema sp.]
MMRKIFALVLFTASAALTFAADPAEGFWVSIEEKTGKPAAGWEIYIQNGRLYGRILSIAGFSQDTRAANCRDNYRDFPVQGRVSEMPVVGTTWIFGLLPGGRPGLWKDGHVIDPAEGRIYGCKIIFHPADKKFRTDTLEMRGTFGPFGRSQFWRRATHAEAASLN